MLPFNSPLISFQEIFGIKKYLIKKIKKKLEINSKINSELKSLVGLTRRKKRVVNIILSKTFNINFSFDYIILFYILKMYLIRHWKGLRIFFNRPSNGQRTRSNCSINGFYSNLLKKKIKQMSKKNSVQIKDNKNYFINIKKKIKKSYTKKIKKTSKIVLLSKLSEWM